ncbi:MAG: hypothetical protein AAB368_13515 [bacterium]
MPFIIPALLILQLPAEWRTPLFTVRSVAVTNLGLTVALVLLAGAWNAVRRPRPYDVLDWAALAWGAAVFVAGLAAPADFPAAARGAARLIAGPLLFLLLRPSLAAPGRTRAAVLLAGVGAVAVLLAMRRAGWSAEVANVHPFNGSGIAFWTALAVCCPPDPRRSPA